MIDRTHAGKPCKSLRLIPDPVSHYKVQPGQEGTILHEMEDSLQRHLVFVRWSETATFYVKPDEIEI